jgi:uncharacterized protein with FMN-binding domain
MLLTIITILGVIGVLAVPMIAVLRSGLYGKRLKTMVARDVDLSKLDDGVYTASYHQGPWTYEVAVTVTNHSATKIQVVGTSRRLKALKDWREMAANSKLAGGPAMPVDVVSGATLKVRASDSGMHRILSSSLR